MAGYLTNPTFGLKKNRLKNNEQNREKQQLKNNSAGKTEILLLNAI